MTPDNTTANEQLYLAHDTQQIIVEGDYLRIGVGNFRQDAETGDVTAGLWFFVRGNAELDEVKRVRENEEFDFIDHHIRVAEINLEGGYLVLAIQKPNEVEQE